MEIKHRMKSRNNERNVNYLYLNFSIDPYSIPVPVGITGQYVPQYMNPNLRVDEHQSHNRDEKCYRKYENSIEFAASVRPVLPTIVIVFPIVVKRDSLRHNQLGYAYEYPQHPYDGNGHQFVLFQPK